MKIQFAGIKVDDQEKALKFYTEILGFLKKDDFQAGGVRWLTVSSNEEAGDIRLVLEPNLPPSDKVQKILYDAGFPATILSTDNIEKEFENLKKKGVRFHGKPKTISSGTSVPFDDTCGNIIMLVQPAT